MLQRSAFLVPCLFVIVFICTPTPSHSGICYQCQPNGDWPECVGGLDNGGYICSVQGQFCALYQPCGPGKPACFVAGTQISTPEGARSIEDIGIGDQVLSLYEDRGEIAPAHVTRVYKSLQYDYYVINGTIEVTEAHPFQVQGQWVSASGLKLGDQLVGADGSTVVIRSIEMVDRGVRVYNIEVAGPATFFADGVLVHNKGPNPQG